MIESAFSLSRAEWWRQVRNLGMGVLNSETLEPVRGWKHEFSMAPAAQRKRVARRLFMAVTK